jgi:glycosyltransferase involved in cell wall biosynthesis
MKKLLQINTVANTGSTGRIAEGIGLLAMSNNWESHIVFGRYGNESQSQLLKIGSKLSIYWHVIMTRLFDSHGFHSDHATFRLIRHIDKLQPDVIQLHNLHGYYLNIDILFNYLAAKDIPVVMTLHDCWTFTGHCTHFTFNKCDKWKSLCEKCPQLKDYPSSLLADRSKLNYTVKNKLFNSVTNLTLVPVSRWLDNLLKESFLKNQPSKVIYNGVDIKQFYPKNTDDLKSKFNLFSKFVILGVANGWDERKGLHDFIKLSKSLAKDEIVVLIGLSKAQTKMLPINIIGLERTNSVDELAEWYSTADVYVNTSLEETFGLTTVEAMACGTPVVVYDATACPEIVSSEVGFVVEKNNIDRLRQNIQKLRKNGKASYTKACQQRVVNHYNQEERFQEYVDLYNNLIAKI